MIQKTILLLLSFFLYSSIAASQSQSVIQKEYLEVSEQVERRITSNIKSYLGPNSRVIVTASIRGNSNSVNEKKENTNWMVMGYAPPPQESDFSDKKPLQGVMTVNIQVEKNINEKQREQIIQISKQSVKGMKARVKVETTLDPLPKLNADSDKVDPQRALASNPPSPTKTPPPLWSWEGLKDSIGLSLLVSSILFCLAFLLFGIFLLRILSKISAQIGAKKDVSSPESRSRPEIIQTITEIKNTSGPRTPTSKTLQSAGSLMDRTKSIARIEFYIQENPLLFLKALSSSEDELWGLKSLIIHINADSQNKLKQLIGIPKIVKAEALGINEGYANFNFNLWLQIMIEKVELKKLAGTGFIESLLSNENAIQLSSTDPLLLYKAVKSINTAPAWRLFLEIASPEFIQNQLNTEKDDILEIVMKGALNEEGSAIKNSVNEVLNYIQKNQSSTDANKNKADGSTDLLEANLLPVLLKTIERKILGDDEKWIQKIEKHSPQIAKLLKQKIWTLDKLKEIKDDDLRNHWMDLDYTEKAKLILGLPEPYSQRMTQLLPTGTGKTIVLDTVNKMKKSVSETQNQELLQGIRSFLESLRQKVSRGEIQLIPLTPVTETKPPENKAAA